MLRLNSILYKKACLSIYKRCKKMIKLSSRDKGNNDDAFN